MIVAPPARHVGWLLGAAAVAASAAVQWPALGNSFRHDDFLLFYQAANLPVADFLLHTHGGHLLMTRNAIHLACTTLFGLEPLPYMALGLATHLANVALLFVLVSRLAGRPAVAALAAGLWGMSPVNQSSVSWPTAYGNVVATMLVLAVAVGLAGVVARRRPPGALAPLGWATGLLVAATCFGTGVAATVAAPAMAWLVVQPEAGRRRIVVTLGAATAVLVVAYAILRPPHTESAVDLARLPPLYVAQLFGSLVSFACRPCSWARSRRTPTSASHWGLSAASPWTRSSPSSRRSPPRAPSPPWRCSRARPAKRGAMRSPSRCSRARRTASSPSRAGR